MQDSLSQTFALYKLIDPRDDLPHYVGYTDDPDRRLREHLSGKSVSRMFGKWIKELKALGLEPIMEIIETIVGTIHETLEREAYWIQKLFNEGAPLINQMNNKDRRAQQAIYLPPDQKQMLKLLAALEEREISDIAKDAFSYYIEKSPYNAVLPMILNVQKNIGVLEE